MEGSPVRVLILAPASGAKVTGNAVSVGRIARGLTEAGVETRVLATGDGDASSAIAQVASEFAPDVVHAYHAWKCGRWAVGLAARVPLVVSLAGTDIHEGLHDPARADTVVTVIRATRIVLATSQGILDDVTTCIPNLAGRLRVVPKGVRPGVERFDLRGAVEASPGDVVFFLPAGVRPIKGHLFPLAPLSHLRAEGVRVRLVYAGPVLDQAYWDRLAAAIREVRWARHVGVIPHAAMADAMSGADCVVNTSESEGGSNAVAEAMCAGRAVLASDVDGNRAFVEDGVTGLLYRSGSSEDFAEKARRLAAGAALRTALGEAAQAWARGAFDPVRETAALVAVYREAMGRV